MSEGILIPETITSKKERYELLVPQIIALVEGEPDLIANLANIVSALKYGMNFFWVGVYLVKGLSPFGRHRLAGGDAALSQGEGEKYELVLGPFQGPVACTRIAKGKGVCGASWQREETIIVKNVDEFPGHIACSSLSKSEIVLPFFKDQNVAGVLDVDSDKLSDFDETDAHYLMQVTSIIEKLI